MIGLAAAAALGLGAGCPGGNGVVGDSCNRHEDCDATLQCSAHMCAPRCERAPDCGDGYACDDNGYCRRATAGIGEACDAEAACAPGLSCQIDGPSVDANGRLATSCAEQTAGSPAGATCTVDDDCRNGTCALGHCIDLCAASRDCGSGTACMDVPRVEAEGVMFGGCVQARGNLTWTIPVSGPTADVLLPVPSGAQHAALVMAIDDRVQSIGATSVFSPSNVLQYRRCPVGLLCDPADAEVQHYANAVRHRPAIGQSVLAMPTSATPLEPGAYRVQVASTRPTGGPGSAIPRLTAVLAFDSSPALDLHFHFLDLAEHPCQAQLGAALAGRPLSATTAPALPEFRGYLEQLSANYARAGIAIGEPTYTDIKGHPELDGLDSADIGDLLQLGRHARGIDVFFVRTMSPVGVQAYSPNPGPAGIAGTRQSGIVIGVDALCYRDWTKLAQLTSHAIARYMGLPHNVEPDPRFRDRFPDSDDAPTNLMFYSEIPSGTDLSPGQIDVLRRSPVLR